jgi:hypothetical protein
MKTDRKKKLISSVFIYVYLWLNFLSRLSVRCGELCGLFFSQTLVDINFRLKCFGVWQKLKKNFKI